MLHLSILVGQTKYILKDMMDDFLSLKIKIFFKIMLKHMSISMLFLKIIKLFLKKSKTQAQELKENHHKRFIKGSEKSSRYVFYNYYCHIDHISLDCKLKKRNNIINVI
jgi:hypothetical protein